MVQTVIDGIRVSDTPIGMVHYSPSLKRHVISGVINGKKQWINCTCSSCVPKSKSKSKSTNSSRVQRGGIPNLGALAGLAGKINPNDIAGLAGKLDPNAIAGLAGKMSPGMMENLNVKALSKNAAALGIDPAKFAQNPEAALEKLGPVSPEQLRDLGLGQFADVMEKNPELAEHISKEATGRTMNNPRDSEALRAPLQVTHSWYARAPLYQVFDSYVCIKKDTLGQLVDLVKILAEKKF